ncbi:ABC transporter substrate-binding protein [Candidatus Aerophobetes bacterium]|nr:ABC transporter substrate-binding protein [Candidatus Aerophobetes bacterium]
MRKAKIVVLVALFTFVLFFSGIAAAQTIKIGALFALTGGLAPYGPPIVNGAKLAVEQVNRIGGIFGRKLELIIRDTATAPAVGRDAASLSTWTEWLP